MTADRHALNAALEYASKLEDEMAHRQRAYLESQEECRQLRRQLRDVRDAVAAKDTVPTNQCNEAATMSHQPETEEEYRRRRERSH